MKILRNSIMLLVFASCFCLFNEITGSAKKVVTTENGAKLQVYHDMEGDYGIGDIIEEREEIIIPETYDGVHNITEIDLSELSGEKKEKVKKIHLSKNIKDINEYGINDWDMASHNIYECLPNLSSITIDKENPYFYAENNMIITKKDHKLLAVAPHVSGILKINKNISEIQVNALINLPYVTGIEVDEANPKYMSKEGILYDKEGKQLICFPIAKPEKTVTLPEGLEYIEIQAAERLKFTEKIIMPSTLKKVGDIAFRSSSIKEVKLNEKLQVLGEGAFQRCELKKLKLPSGLRSMEIASIQVKKLIIPERVGEIYGYTDDGYYPIEEWCDCILADVLVIKSPTLSIKEEFSKSDWAGQKVYAYKGSLAYKEAKRMKKKGYDIRVRILKGKVYKTPKSTGKIDTSWYSQNKKKLYISTPAQLAGLSWLSQKKGYYFENKKIILKKDLNMKKYKNFQPIRKFYGTFNGNGKTIKNLRIYQLCKNVGLFSKGAPTVRNLTVKGKVVGGNYTGGIVGGDFAEAEIINCHFYGTVYGFGYTGKLFVDPKWTMDY